MGTFDTSDDASDNDSIAEVPRSKGRRGKNARIQKIRLRNISKIRNILTNIQKEVITAGNASPEINKFLFLKAKPRSKSSDSASTYTKGLKASAIVQMSSAENGDALLIILRISDHSDPKENEKNESGNVIQRTLRVDDVIQWETRDDWGKWDLSFISENKRNKLLLNPSLNFNIDNDDFRIKVGEALTILKNEIKSMS